MITFDLSCDSDHRFEGWFRDREDFEDQLKNGLVACPLCNSTRITKRLSAVAVHVSRRTATATPPSEPATDRPQREARAPVPAPEPFFRALSQFIEKNFEDVGSLFAEEARKIDRGETDPRNIRGTTTEAEEEALAEEGVEFFKVALPKYDA